ncbi:hypothetical protein Tco_0839488 [Tanacetum coccineum]|uniref:Uncharacterized protein n=1 Tax=Tanacetum coccineum TaxID=301880 RepID=A0ABQ5AVF0_9ASTR
MGIGADLGEHLAPMERPDKISIGDRGGFGAWFANRGLQVLVQEDDLSSNCTQMGIVGRTCACLTYQLDVRMTQLLLLPYSYEMLEYKDQMLYIAEDSDTTSFSPLKCSSNIRLNNISKSNIEWVIDVSAEGIFS